jgi:hypothetical protein
MLALGEIVQPGAIPTVNGVHLGRGIFAQGENEQAGRVVILDVEVRRWMVP